MATVGRLVLRILMSTGSGSVTGRSKMGEIEIMGGLERALPAVAAVAKSHAQDGARSATWTDAMRAPLRIAPSIHMPPCIHSRAPPPLLAAPRKVLNDLPFIEARSMARSMGLSSVDEWLEYSCPGAYRLPKDPENVWASEWVSWDDWLGTMLTLDDAMDLVKSAGIADADAYGAFVKEGSGDAGTTAVAAR